MQPNDAWPVATCSDYMTVDDLIMMYSVHSVPLRYRVSSQDSGFYMVHFSLRPVGGGGGGGGFYNMSFVFIGHPQQADWHHFHSTPIGGFSTSSAVMHSV